MNEQGNAFEVYVLRMKVFIVSDIRMGKFLKSKNMSYFDVLRTQSESF